MIKNEVKKIKKLIVGLSFCLVTALLTSAVGVQAQLPDFELPENLEMNITLELLPDARCHVTVNIETQFESEGWGDPIITSASAILKISSPSYGQLKFDASGSVTLSPDLAAEMPPEISMMSAEMLNAYIEIAGIEGQTLSNILSGLLAMIPDTEGIEIPTLPELEDIVLEELRCTKFSWSDPTLEAGLSTTLSGSIFEDEYLLDELPIDIEGSVTLSETSISLTMEASSGETVEQLTLDIDLTASGTTVAMVLILDGYFKLPVVDDQVQWGFEMPEMDLPSLENIDLENLDDLLGGYDIDFTLEVPSGASVSGLPSGYSQEDNDTYTWSGDDAAGALDMVLTGGAQPDITYDYEAPPSEFPWLWVGVLIVVMVVAAAAVVALRRR